MTVDQMTQMPWLDFALRKNSFADFFQRPLHQTASLSILAFVGKAIKERREQVEKSEAKIRDDANGRKDFLTRYIELQQNNPEIPPW